MKLKTLILRILSAVVIGLFTFLHDFMMYREVTLDIPVELMLYMFGTGFILAMLAFAFEDLFNWIFKKRKKGEKTDG